MVRTVHSYTARGSGRRGSCQPQVSGAVGLHPAAGGGDLLVPFSGQPVVQQDHGHRPRRDGRDRARVFSALAASTRDLGGQRALALMGENLFRVKDRKGADLALGFTAEEVMTSIALKELRSYKQLPQIWYQIAPKFRDEPRPKSGLLRV